MICPDHFSDIISANMFTIKVNHMNKTDFVFFFMRTVYKTNTSKTFGKVRSPQAFVYKPASNEWVSR